MDGERRDPGETPTDKDSRIRELEARVAELEARCRERGAGELSTARRQEQELRDAQRVARVGSWEWAAATDTVTWSEELYRIFGLDPRTQAPSYALQHRHYTAESWARLQASVVRAMETGAPYEIDLELVRPDGTTRWVEARGEVIRAAGGGIVGLRGTVHDVTERKRAEEALTLAKDRLALALRASKAGTWNWNVSTGALEWSDELFRLFGLDAETRAATFETWRQTLHPDDRQEAEGRIERALSTRTPLDSEYRIIRPGGQVAWIAALGEGQYDAQGQPLRMAGICLDISERKQMEEALRAAMQRLDHLLERSPLAVIEWSSSDYRIVRWSGGAARIFGWTAEETVGKKVTELPWIHPDDWPQVQATAAAMLSGTAARRVQTNRNVRKDGAVIHCEWYNSTLHDPSGAFAALSLVLDVTERKRVEAALREADQRKNEFIGVLSHELRNPLGPIRSSLFVLERVPPGGEQARRAVDTIDRQVGHLTRLVDDLLDVTRISSGKVRLQRSTLDLRELVRQSALDHRVLLARHAVALHLPEEPVRIEADPTRLAQVLGNLITNAAKFTPEGGEISVALSLSASGRQAVLQVEDTGIGIDAATLEGIFEPFVQADRTLDRSRGGLGLGLAFVKGLVELHGGEVAAASAGPGRGACFTVRLPLEESAVPRQPPPREEQAPRGGRKVLIIEDNHDAANSLAEALVLSGHDVIVAYEGATGLARARELSPDAIVCDIGLPGDLDGYAVARALRAAPGTASVYLIALTGYAAPEDQRRALEAGFDLHLPKPPNLAALARFLAQSPSRSSVP